MYAYAAHMQLLTNCDLLTINTQVVLSVLFSSSINSHTCVSACITDLCTAQRQHSATGQHLRGKQKQFRDQITVHT